MNNTKYLDSLNTIVESVLSSIENNPNLDQMPDDKKDQVKNICSSLKSLVEDAYKEENKDGTRE